MSDLKQRIDYPSSHQAFSKLVRKLEKNNYLESIYYQNYKKYLFLTSKGLQEAGLSKSYPLNKDVMLHDLICVNVLRHLLEDKATFIDGSLSLEDEGRSNRPDGRVQLQKQRSIALEIELTQKDSTRIENKFKEYMRSDYNDFVLYLFTRPSVFTAYQKIINRLDENINPLIKRKLTSKIILLIAPTIKNNTFCLKDADCYFQGRVFKFEELKKQYFI